MKKPTVFYPLIIFIFLVNYHFYSFYKQNFFQMKKIITKKINISNYEAIQSEHPYYEIWKLAQTDNRVFLVMNNLDTGNVDYTTTYFKRLIGDKRNYYLSELSLFINYFFYPRKIESFSFDQLIRSKNIYKKRDIIISDFDFDSFYLINYKDNSYIFKEKTEKERQFDQQFLSLYHRLKNIKVFNKNFVITNRHKEKPYFIYELIK